MNLKPYDYLYLYRYIKNERPCFNRISNAKNMVNKKSVHHRIFLDEIQRVGYPNETLSRIHVFDTSSQNETFK